LLFPAEHELCVLAVQYDRHVYVSGQIALNPASMTLIDADPAAQCKLALRHVSQVLSCSSGGGVCLCDCLLVVCYVTSSDAALAAQTALNLTLSSSAHVSTVSKL